MSDLTLFGCPKACSLVSHIALEMTGAPYTFEVIDLFKGEHRSNNYLALNPRGKVPTLREAGRCITENVAILHWLAARFPSSNLLPQSLGGFDIQALSDLTWFASGIHPIITRMLVPGRFLPSEDCQAALRALAILALSSEFEMIDKRLAGRKWWLDDWSALDAYLFWIWARSGEGPIDLSAYPNYARHACSMLVIPQVQRVLERERGHRPCFETLEASVLQTLSS